MPALSAAAGAAAWAAEQKWQKGRLIHLIEKV
jgi:hypothetical protein